MVAPLISSVYYGTMNATSQTQEHAAIRELAVDDRVSVRLLEANGAQSPQPTSFTLQSAGSEAASYGVNPAPAIARAIAAGRDVYFFSAEGVYLVRPSDAPVQRIQLQVNQVVRIDGELFTVTQTGQRKLKLIPVVTS